MVNIQAQPVFTKSYLLLINKSFKFVVSFSLFSFLVSYFSLINILVESSNGIFNRSMDKNYMFLLCNGILVFLAKNSGLIGGSSSSDVVTSRSPVQELPEKKETVVTVSSGEQELVGEDENGALITKDDSENGVEIEEEEELMSTEELNKKCEEFIKKMKEGIKWESQKLVMIR